MTEPIRALKKGDYAFRNAIFIGNNDKGRIYVVHIANTNHTYCIPVIESPELDRIMKSDMDGITEIHNIKEWDSLFENTSVVKKFKETSAQETYHTIEQEVEGFVGIGERYNYY